MKSNIIFKLVLLIATFLIYNSCNDEFLELVPLDEVSSETFWNTEADLFLYNSGIYKMSGDRYGTSFVNLGHGESAWNSHKRSIWYIDCFADNWVSDPRQGRMMAYNEIRSGVYNISSSPRLYGYDGWEFLRQINFGLQNYNRADIPQEVINKYVAEARFFRAWFYADKIEKFGKVSWIEKPLNIDDEELFASRDSRDFVMEKVLEDIDFAIEHLPESWGSDYEPGRINKYIAMVLKSRICLFEGTFRKYHGDANPEFFGSSNPDMWLEAAANAAKKVMDSGLYEIYNTGDPDHDYSSWQRITDLRGNPEVIHWIEYVHTQMKNNQIQNYFRRYGGNASKSLVDDYLCTDGKPAVTEEGVNPLYVSDDSIEDVFKNRDPRLRQTILHPDDAVELEYFAGEGEILYPRLIGMEGGNPSTTGYHVIKNFNHKQVFAGWYTAEFPAIMMRYAEVLLNYAEAKAELGELTQDDLDISINQLRDRVNMPHLVISDIPDDPRYEDISPLITEIRRERRIELVGEGFRYNDLIRWKWGKLLENPDLGIRWNDEAQERYSGTNLKSSTIEDPITGEMKEYIDPAKGTTYETPVFNEAKHYLWPIPLSILSQNTNISQNPGW